MSYDAIPLAWLLKAQGVLLTDTLEFWRSTVLP